VSSPSNVNLSIAALQSRRRSQLSIGLGILAILILGVGAAVFFAPSFEHVGSPALELEPAISDNALEGKGPSKVAIQLDEEGYYAVDESIIAALELLRGDSVYGQLVREIEREQEQEEHARPSPDQERQLAAALSEKLAALDRALLQAMFTNNLALIETLSRSRFFKDYAVNQLTAWNWIATPTYSAYELASRSLGAAEALENSEEIIRSLESIQQLTGYQGHQSRIRKLKDTLATRYEDKVKTQMLSYMTDKNYAEVLEVARTHRTLVASDSELKDVTRQAEVALSRERRDRLYDSALQQAQSDDWESAVVTLQSIPKHLRDYEINELAVTGGEIISTKKTIGSLIARPDRLADKSVEKYAQKQIKYGMTFVPLSDSLSKMIASLSDYLDDALKTVTVNITSDNRAVILIPRLGHIQPTRSKVLYLQRADYRFIIRCEGERDAVENLDLTNSSVSDSVNIRLACES
jgi:hypothetical protein